MDFEKEINQILEILPKKRITYLFSATMTNKVGKLQRASLNNAVKVEVSSKYKMIILYDLKNIIDIKQFLL